MATPERAAEKSSTPDSRRERKLNVRLSDLGATRKSSSSSKPRRLQKPAAAAPDTEIPHSDRPELASSVSPAKHSGIEIETNKTDAGLKHSDDLQNQSPTNNLGRENGGAGDGARKQSSKNRSRKPSAASHDTETPQSGRHKRAKIASPAKNLGRDTGGEGLAEIGVNGWLDHLGLSQYRYVFKEHEVDEAALPLLTLEDLKDMGIRAVGSRRRLYSAIQELKRPCRCNPRVEETM